MPNEIKYEVVSNVSIRTAMAASGRSATGERKMKKGNADVWNHTVATVMEHLDFSEVVRDTSKDGIKDIGTILKGQMENYILAQYTAEEPFPEEGTNRQGKKFKIMGAKGIQWSSWDESVRIWDYLGTIAKVIAYGHEDVLYPDDNTVGARCDVLKLCVTPESPMESIRRTSEALQNNLDLVTEQADVVDAHSLISALAVNNLDIEMEMVSLVGKLNALLHSADDDEKSTVRNGLMKLVSTHYPA